MGYAKFNKYFNKYIGIIFFVAPKCYEKCPSENIFPELAILTYNQLHSASKQIPDMRLQYPIFTCSC